MNIFAVNTCPRVSAEQLCDKHVVKMILETGQILSTVHRRYGNEDERLYKSTHAKHPSTLWAGDCQINYDWLFEHFTALNDEYWFRYGKDHLTYKKLNDVVFRAPKGMKVGKFSLPTPAMPDECKIVKADGSYDVVESYRKYYREHKKHIAKWTKRAIPSWFLS